jgi:hypothetical protein
LTLEELEIGIFANIGVTEEKVRNRFIPVATLLTYIREVNDSNLA